jgi:UDP-N-acetylglucosamine 2-epimerase
MKVFICKIFKEENIECNIGRLVSKEKKKAGINLKVFCVDEQIRQRLEAAGISCNVINNFWHQTDIDTESDYETAYELSDRLQASVGNYNSSKFHGINILTLEYNTSFYANIVELSKLCQRTKELGCTVLILVITGPASIYSPNINTKTIKTVGYGNEIKYSKIVQIIFRAVQWGCSLIDNLLHPAKDHLKTEKNNPIDSKGEANPEKQRALFVVSTSLYGRPALAICNECLKDGLIPYVATYPQDIANIFQSSHHAGISSRASLIAPLSCTLQAGKTLALFRKLNKHVNSLRKMEHDEFSAAGLCYRFLSIELPRLCLVATYYIVFMEYLIKSVTPAIICLMPDGFFLQQIAAAVAKNWQIPTLACSAALEHGNARSYMRHLHAEKLAAMGNRIKNTYIACGLEPERVIVTGVAHFDLLFHRNREQDAQVLLAQGIDPGKGIVVFATENLPAFETIEALQGVINAVLKIKNMQLVVKVHPSEDAKPYLEAAAQYHSPGIHVTKDVDLYALINCCNLFIVKFSTTALEAMMIDKPVMVINLSGKSVPVPYAEEGAAIGAYRFEDIEPAIMKMLYNEDTRARYKAGRNKFVREWAGEPDGKASQRIISLMREMITASSNAKKE